MSIEATIMVECRIMDAQPTKAHLLRVGQPVIFGGRVHHIKDSKFTNDTPRTCIVSLVHFDIDGKPQLQTVTVADDFLFECLAIVPLKYKGDKHDDD